MSKDTFGHMLSFLDINSIEKLQQTNQDNKQIIKQFSHIYYENALKELYGDSIITLLKANDDDYRKNIKLYFHEYKCILNLRKTNDILEMFYNCIHQNKLTTNHNLFIMIYDLCYVLLNENSNKITLYGHTKTVLKKHRDNWILKHYSDADIENKGLNFIMNATKHIDRWG